MNLNPRTWYIPQWITNIALIIFLLTIFNSSYALFGGYKYGGLTPFSIIATPLVLYSHLYNFGLQADLSKEDFLYRSLPGIGLIVGDIFFTLVLATVFRRVIYWREIFTVIFTMIVYIISIFYCFSKIETKTITYEELDKFME